MMNEEERSTWKDYVDDFTQFFGEIIMRQQKQDKPAEEGAAKSDAEGEDAKSEVNKSAEVPVAVAAPAEGEEGAAAEEPVEE